MKCPEGTSKTADGQCEAQIAGEITNDDGTKTIVCPPKTKLDGNRCVAEIIAIDSNAVESTYFCDYGYINSTDIKVDEGGGCFEVASKDDCDLEWGKLVNSCKASDRRTDLDYCDYGAWNTYIDDNGDEQIGGGCWAIRTAEERANCDTRWATIVKKCTWLNP